MKEIILSILIISLIGCSKSEGSTNDDGGPDEDNVELPSLILSDINSIGHDSAIVQSNVTDDGGASVTSRGISWGLASMPTINDNSQSSGAGEGVYSLTIENLIPLTTYFVRAYAINGEGTAYSNELSFTTTGPCQGEFSDDIRLQSQEDLDVFGANNYCRISGSLWIDNLPSSGNGTRINNLTALASIERVGALLITDQFELQSLDGLNIEIIDDFLVFNDNETVTDIEAFSSILGVPGGIAIINNDGITNLNSLSNLSSNIETLQILENNNLSNINGLNNVTQIIGDFILKLNGNLQEVNGFNNLTNIGGDLEIIGNPVITLNGFPILETIGGNLIISQNVVGGEIDGFDQLSNISGYANISSSDLVSFNGFSSLEMVDGFMELFITGPSNLNNLMNLHDIGNNLTIGQTTITSLAGLEELTTISGDLSIVNNSLLVDFCSLQGFLASGGLQGDSNISGNAFNPTVQDIIDGNCSQ